MTEHKVRSVLKEEALTLWSKKTEEECTKRVGLFGLRKEEDRDKREIFVKKHPEEHFEAYLNSFSDDEIERV